jgi:hypothetical protein
VYKWVDADRVKKNKSKETTEEHGVDTE